MTSLIVTGDILLGSELIPGAVTIIDDRIVEVHRGADADRNADLEAAIVAPGLIDLQVNGGYGVEVGADPAAIRTLAERLPEAGVTAFLPTLITSPADFYPRVFEAVRVAGSSSGAEPLGLHLEGPFLSPRRAGAHKLELIEAADDVLFASLLDSGDVRLMTLAPERPGASERIRRLRERGIVVSLGHTDATHEQFVAGVDAGATMATHLFNAMSPFGHRAPGVIGAALVDDRVAVGLIADGVHSHPASVQLAIRAKGIDRIALVSDLMPAAGMPPGNYTFGGQTVTVDERTARLDGGTLAGSIEPMDEAIRNVVRWTDASPADALRMASEVPARILGLPDRGCIEPGAIADLVLLDHDLTVQATITRGNIAYKRTREP
jgi:N-acetylglucosamine-6-phosphate deacetylase